MQEPEERLTRIPGIDTDLALRRASGNRELAASLLRMFTTENRDSTERIKALLQAGKKAEAISLVHKIKGSAGIIAANTVAAAALALEQAFSTGADWEEPLRELEQHLDTVVQGATCAQGKPVSFSVASARMPVPEQIFPLLRQLDVFLTENNMQALETFRDLQALLRGLPELAPPLRSVVDPLERLDFIEARARLRDVVDVIERMRRS
jgi:HPt (histidine-containing phosphotransfer) domain-containing protein